jgi:hypothetical protein
MPNFIGPITNSLIDNIIKEFKKKEIKEKIIKNVCDPIIYDISVRFYPYFILILTILGVIIILLSIIIILLFSKKNNIYE